MFCEPVQHQASVMRSAGAHDGPDARNTATRPGWPSVSEYVRRAPLSAAAERRQPPLGSPVQALG
eukprot:365213-Chlamydomonas_euryale.AAC.6